MSLDTSNVMIEENTENNTEKNIEKKVVLKKWKKIFGISSIVLLLLTGIYFGISVYFMDHYFFHTVINGSDYSLKSVVEAEIEEIAITPEYILNMVGRNNISDCITADEISLNYSYASELNRVENSQNYLIWIVSLFHSNKYDIEPIVTYDQEALVENLKQSDFFVEKNRVSTKDAYIGDYDVTTNCFSIIPEEQGAALSRDLALAAVESAIKNKINVVDFDETKSYETPKINSANQELNDFCNRLNNCLDMKITYNFGDSTEILTGQTIREWMIVDGSQLKFDEELVYEYVKELANLHDTYGRNYTFHTTDGRQITLQRSGYGWKMDKPAETLELIALLEAGESVTKTAVYSEKGVAFGENDIGDTYVEIDLSMQHLYVYQEGVLTLETDFVSGNMTKGWGTPQGIFGLTYKTQDAVLRGETYETPVNYWMPFNGNVGMHDATWRKKFGGDIYINSGSHGCINLPLKKAEAIYQIVSENMPIICYYAVEIPVEEPTSDPLANPQTAVAVDPEADLTVDPADSLVIPTPAVTGTLN